MTRATDAPRSARPARLGMMTPSSNTNAEPTTYAMLAGIPGVTAHFSRFPLPALDQTVGEEFLREPAMLLAEAAVDALVLHVTAGSFTGLDAERTMCAKLEEITGVPTTTASLATVEALAWVEAERPALVFPGPQGYAKQIVEEYARHGLVLGSHHWMDQYAGNLAMGVIPEDWVEEFVVAGCPEDADAVVVLGTNLRVTPLVERIEQRLGVTVVDSTAATLWQMLRMVGVDARPAGWGRLLRGDG